MEPENIGAKPIEPNCLDEQFRRSVARNPERVAVIADDGVRGYEELDAEVTSLAAALSTHGVGHGQRVGFLLDRGADAVTALLATMRLGAVFVALDPAFPAPRLLDIVNDCQPKLVVCHNQHRALLADYSGAVRAWADPGTAPEPVTVPHWTASDEDPMYIIYTSGSTGKPKGIVQTYRTIRNIVRWQNTETGIRFSGRVLQNSSLAFDVSLQEILSTLTSGGTLVVSSSAERTDPELMVLLLRRQRVNVIYLSVSTLTRVFADRLDELPDTITDIVTAGEQLYLGNSIRSHLKARPTLQLHNHYGVSESHVVTAHTINGHAIDLPVKVPIGRPVAGARVFVQRDDGAAALPGEPGELVISGPCLALGYLNQPTEQSRRFINADGERRYLTGDLAVQHATGELEFLGRRDHQLKIRGHLVEPGDVESSLSGHPSVSACLVGEITAYDDERQLAAWYTLAGESSEPELRSHLAERLPHYMIPSRFIRLTQFPTGPTGKIDRAALRAIAGSVPVTAPTIGRLSKASELETAALTVMRRVMQRPDLEPDTPFFDAGATSLTLTTASGELGKQIGMGVTTLDLFRFPTTARLAAELNTRIGPAFWEQRSMGAAPLPTDGNEQRLNDSIAVIGLAGRFPGASNVDRLWKMLVDGKLGLREHNGRSAPTWLIPSTSRLNAEKRLVGIVDDAYRFDAEFWGYSEREVEWTDPQQRLLLMCAYAALESAGIPPSQGGNIGVFAGGEFPSYIAHVHPRVQSVGDYLQALIGNDKDFLATRIAYKLNLTGPALTVQTACSTSLVAVHLARQALLQGDCDVAIAGGVSIQVPQEHAHAHEEGLIYSPDGMTRPFDADAAGTNITSGVGLVVLKRATDAIRDRDTILAIIRGSAINNDGADKVGYTAPSASGQARVIRASLRTARLDPVDIDFIEAHGTATPIGDAIEVAALHEVFGGVQKQVLLGSIKGNIGHTNRASGIAGLIKTVLALYHGVVPATLGHVSPHTELRLDRGPFVVPTGPQPLDRKGSPYRAGVSSFGFGGTNAHVVVEEWDQHAGPPNEDPQLLTLSADRSEQIALLATDLADYLISNPKIRTADVAFSRNTGRDRRALTVPIVARDREQLIERLRQTAEGFPAPETIGNGVPGVVFLIPGTGRAVSPAGAHLYRRYSVFRIAVDEVLAVLRPDNATLLRTWLADRSRNTEEILERAELLQPLIFLLSRATAALLMDWGVQPRAIVGNSLGEYTAAVVAGALSVRDATLLIQERGRLEDTLAPVGAMLAAELGWEDAAQFETPTTFRAGNGSRGHTLFSGPIQAITALGERLKTVGVGFRRLPNHKPNHTPLMYPAASSLEPFLREVAWQTPRIPVVSTVDGNLLTAETLADPLHWTRHSTQPIRFVEAIDAAFASPSPTVALEVGPTGGLAALAGIHFADAPQTTVIDTLQYDNGDELEYILERVGELICIGIPIDLPRLHADEPVSKVPLPTYPFGGKEYLLPTPPGPVHDLSARLPIKDREHWFYIMDWQSAPAPVCQISEDRYCLLIGHNVSARADVAEQLRRMEFAVIVSSPDPAELDLACGQLRAAMGAEPNAVVFLDSCVDPTSLEPGDQATLGLTRPLFEFLPVYNVVVRKFRGEKVNFMIATQDMYHVTDEDTGPAVFTTTAVIAMQEQPEMTVRHIDFPKGAVDGASLVTEIFANSREPACVYRGGDRYIPHYRSHRVPTSDTASLPTVENEVWLITGGLGDVGLHLIRHLSGRGARLLVIGRTDPRHSLTLRRKLQQLNEAGVEVHYETADVGVKTELAEAISAGEAIIGTVRGVIHAAAAIDGDAFLAFLHDLDADLLKIQLNPKLYGLECLNEVLRSHDLSYRCVFSSNSVVLGGLGYGAYATANTLMSNLASSLSVVEGESCGWQVIDWDLWETARPSTQGIALGSSLTTEAMPVAQALLCFNDLLKGPRRALISTTDLIQRRELIRTLTTSGDAEEPPGLDERSRIIQQEESTRIARDAWQRALRTTVNEHTNFVQLGGDSLAAIKVVLEINRRLGTSLTAHDMLHATDFSDFNERLAADRGSAENNNHAERHLGPLTAQPHWSIASALQDRWFAMDKRGYGHISLWVEIAGPVDPRLAHKAIEHLCRRHAILRSRYDDAGQQLIQQQVEGWTPTFRFTDATRRSEQATVSAMREATDRASKRFDLTRDVPFELELFRLAYTANVLIGRIHHIAVDGWSFSLLLEDFELVYATLERDADPAALAPRPQYAAFAAEQRAYLSGERIAKVREDWRRHFADAPPPTRLPRPEISPHIDGTDPDLGRCVNLVINRATVLDIATFAQKRRTTLFPVFASAFALMLKTVTGESDIVFGTTAAGRNFPETEEMIGVFVNPLPIRVDLAKIVHESDAIGPVEASLLEFHRCQNYLLADLVQHVEPFVGLDINDTFHAYIIYQNFPSPQVDGPRTYVVGESDDFSIDSTASRNQTHGKLMREFELIILERQDGSVSLNFWYRQGRFSREQVHQWSERYLSILLKLASA